MNSDLYTVKELAAILRVHPTTIRRAINSGKISGFRVGHGKKSSFRIYKSEIERMAAFDIQEIIENRAKELAKENSSCKKELLKGKGGDTFNEKTESDRTS